MNESQTHSGWKGVAEAATFLGITSVAGKLSAPKGPSLVAAKLASKPKWELSNDAMGPAWAAGYGLLGLSGLMTWRASSSPERSRALVLSGGYLAMNAVAGVLGKTNGKTVAKDVAEIALIGAYVHQAGKRSPAARWLAVPFLAWLGCVMAGGSVTRKRNPVLSKFF